MTLDPHIDVHLTDDTVEFAFTVENTGSEYVELEFRSGQTADIVVYADGEEVWRWSDDRMFTQAIQTETIEPGESCAREMVWDDPEPGEYTAEASLEATNESIEEETTFEVP